MWQKARACRTVTSWKANQSPKQWPITLSLKSTDFPRTWIFRSAEITQEPRQFYGKNKMEQDRLRNELFFTAVTIARNLFMKATSLQYRTWLKWKREVDTASPCLCVLCHVEVDFCQLAGWGQSIPLASCQSKHFNVCAVTECMCVRILCSSVYVCLNLDVGCVWEKRKCMDWGYIVKLVCTRVHVCVCFMFGGSSRDVDLPWHTGTLKATFCVQRMVPQQGAYTCINNVSILVILLCSSH